jgi:glycosyltransferase involved in cell wall biosynthesis
MKKILFIIEDYYQELGGSFEAFGSTSYQLNKEKIKVKSIFFNNGEIKKRINITKVIKNHDIVHFFGAWTINHIKTIILALIYRKKIIITPMGTFEPWSLSQKKIKKKIALIFYQKTLLKKAHLIHCTSKNEQENIKKLDDDIKTIYIPHAYVGLNYEKKIINSDQKIKKMLFFSRIHKKKGLDMLINAWSELRPTNWILDIIGPDSDGTSYGLKKKIEKYNLTESIFLKEPIFGLNKKKELFIKYDFSILPSKNENFGYSILESLRHSLPVITNTNTPWAEINDYDAGCYISDDYETLKQTLLKVFNFSNKEILKKSQNAYKLSKQYEWKSALKKYEDMYLSLI